MIDLFQVLGATLKWQLSADEFVVLFIGLGVLPVSEGWGDLQVCPPFLDAPERFYDARNRLVAIGVFECESEGLLRVSVKALETIRSMPTEGCRILNLAKDGSRDSRGGA